MKLKFTDTLKLSLYYNWVSKELRNTANDDTRIDIFNYVIGMAEEAGEVLKRVDRLPDHHSASIDPNVLEEMGDYFWYHTAHFVLSNPDKNEYDYIGSIVSYLDDSKGYFEKNAWVCDQLKLLGMYRKNLFSGKQLDLDKIAKISQTCNNHYFSSLIYLGFSVTDIILNNMDKLKKRYPEGRKSKYLISLTERKWE